MFFVILFFSFLPNLCLLVTGFGSVTSCCEPTDDRGVAICSVFKQSACDLRREIFDETPLLWLRPERWDLCDFIEFVSLVSLDVLCDRSEFVSLVSWERFLCAGLATCVYNELCETQLVQFDDVLRKSRFLLFRLQDEQQLLSDAEGVLG